MPKGASPDSHTHDQEDFMRIAEIRDLDGPNLFLMAPAIKIEVADVVAGDEQDIIARLSETVADLHQAVGVSVPTMTCTRMEEPGHIVVAFGWERRAFATSLGTMAAQLVIGERNDVDQVIVDLKEVLERAPEYDDAPLLVKATPDRTPIISITGTNGKTTTSRLIDFVLRHSGYKVGLTSSAGVFINKEQVLSGDYSGPSGARRVLEDHSLDFAVLETARGGLLLRGCGYEAADVALITNVTEDHLGLHGIHSIEGLAAVKAIIARNVRPHGFCVLNADDPNVVAMRSVTPGTPVLFSPNAENPEIRNQVAAGGAAIYVDASGSVIWALDGVEQVVTTLADIPMTFNGKASHQVENALGATAALIGLGLSMDQIRIGLKAFKSDSENSKGRLNVFTINDATVIIDFAHNEAGLIHLLRFARSFVRDDGKLTVVIGTAGDREDQAIRAIARRAMESADRVVLKDSIHYLRGRKAGEMVAIMREAAAEVDRPEVVVSESPDERTATLESVASLHPGDALAVMCIEDYEYLIRELESLGDAMA